MLLKTHIVKGQKMKQNCWHWVTTPCVEKGATVFASNFAKC